MKRFKICVVNPHKELTVDGYLFKNQQASIGHNLCKPWCDLYASAQSHHFDFVTFDQVTDLSSLDGAIFLDRPFNSDQEANTLLSLPIKKYLFLFECAMIRPDNWDQIYHSRFEKVFTWSDLHVDGNKYIKINFNIEPHPLNGFEIDEAKFRGRKLITLIAGSKAKEHQNELYSHRMTAIRWYEHNHSEDFDLYGTGWNPMAFPSYKGPIKNKIEVLSSYNFSICYENATGFPGYITEKILDCLSAQTVAIYGGDTGIGIKIPEKCFIDVRGFKSLPDLHAYIKSMPANEYLGYIAEIQNFFSNGSATQFSNRKFVDTVIDTLTTDFAANGIEPASSVQPTRLAPKLVVCVGYGNEQTIFTRAKSIWDYHASFFSGFDLYFLRTNSTAPCGTTAVVEGNIIEIGVAGLEIPSHSDTNLYSETGIWSKMENYLTIYRQVCSYEFLLNQYKENFHLFSCTVTSVLDFDGLIHALQSLPSERCFAGMPNTLEAPRYSAPPLQGLNIIFGTNTMLSRDLLELVTLRYVGEDLLNFEPNDVWLSSLLQDIPRQALPFFSFINYTEMRDRSEYVFALATALNTQGHFQFRVKTEPSTYPPATHRKDVDPWIMLSIVKAIACNRSLKKYKDFLQYFQAAFVGGTLNAIPSRSATHVFNGTTAITWNDTMVSREPT